MIGLGFAFGKITASAMTPSRGPQAWTESPWSLEQGVKMTDVIGSGNGLRFAAALVVCLVRELAHELPVFNGTAASFHFFVSVGTDHLFGRIGEARCC